MGQGYTYMCRKCHHTYDIHLGIGMLHLMTYCDKLVEIAAGDYGEELKEALETTDDATIDESTQVFVCDSCNAWKTDIDATLWVPNGPEYASDGTDRKRRGEVAHAKRGALCVTSWELHEHFHVLKHHYHTCEACGQRMHKATEENLEHLSCPRCGTPNEPCGFVYWD